MWEVLKSQIEVVIPGLVSYKGSAIIFVILLAVALAVIFIPSLVPYKEPAVILAVLAVLAVLLVLAIVAYKSNKGKGISIHPPNRPPKDKTTGSQEREHKDNGTPGPELISPPQKAGDTFKDCDDCPEMVIVPAGEFLMGSPKDESERYSDEGPQHKVTISQSFAVGKYQVTRGQFKVFIDATGHDAGNDWHNPGFTQTDKHPVVLVSWGDAKAYTEWLSQKTGQQYRLLSEAEWEYVARAGTTTAYHFGNGIFPKQAHYGNKNKGTVQVGSYSANAFGLHDVHGNVWEWVEDCYHTNYNGAPTDGSAWVSNCDENYRVLRGGSWYSNPRRLRSAYHFRYGARNRYIDIGFRIARTL